MNEEDILALGKIMARFVKDESNYVGTHLSGNACLDGWVAVSGEEFDLLIRMKEDQ